MKTIIKNYVMEVIMKNLQKSCCLILVFVVCLFTICGCSAKKVECPFTEITWENTPEDVKALEGEPIDSYTSIYYGTTYTYEKEYNGMKGTVKYMFDDQDKLMSMAWLYIPESDEDMQSVYDTLRNETNRLYGKSGFDSNMGTAMGEVWYLEDGNILIGVMSTGVNEAVQYQFFHPDVSSPKPE